MRGWYDHYGTVRMTRDLVADRSEQEARKATVSTRADYQQIRRLGRIEQHGAWATFDNMVLDHQTGRHICLRDRCLLRGTTIRLEFVDWIGRR